MILHQLFGDGEGKQTRSLRFKVIRPVSETLVVNEVAADYVGRKARVTTSGDVFSLFSFLVNESKEHFLALHLDSKNHIFCIDHVSAGSLKASIVHPRELYKSALLSSAAVVILMHNHPSNDPTPSREDLELTGRLREAGELLGVRVLDHVIIGSGCYVSLADRGLIG
jgi:DNA repair protein RadC